MMGWNNQLVKRRKLDRKRKVRVVQLLQINGLKDRQEELFQTVQGWNRRRHTANSMRFES